MEGEGWRERGGLVRLNYCLWCVCVCGVCTFACVLFMYAIAFASFCVFGQTGQLEPLLSEFSEEEENQMKRMLQRMDLLAKVQEIHTWYTPGTHLAKVQ